MDAQLNVKLAEAPEGTLTQCLDRPETTVAGKNQKATMANLKKIISGYVEAFPDTKSEFFHSDGKMRGVIFA